MGHSDRGSGVGAEDGLAVSVTYMPVVVRGVTALCVAEADELAASRAGGLNHSSSE